MTETLLERPETIRAPEEEKGVGCNFADVLASDHSFDDRIGAAKRALGERVVILGHHYQRDEVVKFADFQGDSLKLSQQAAEQARADYIVFCGVHFMAESADILRRPHQQVVLPDLNAGCSMADMAEIGEVEECGEDLDEVGDLGVVPVTYMNSSAAIKAFTGRRGGSVCTSSNAPAVFRWAFERGERVLFLPDEHLGRNTAYRMGIPLEQMVVWDPKKDFGGLTAEQLRGAKVILWKGYCSVHQRFLPEHVERVRRDYPGIRVIAHPECRWEVCERADEIGSTEKIRKTIVASPPGAQWAVGTEIHLVNRLARQHPDKRVVSLDPNVCVCTTMFRIAPPHLCWTLENLAAGRVVNRIEVDEETKSWARVALERMLALG